MLKLSKYEFRKNRNALLLLIAGLIFLQILYLLALNTKDDDYIFSAAGTLFLYALICYFSIFIFAVTNYYREINSRTSYLIFMTPVSPLRIVLSKMLTVLFLGIILAALLGVLGVWDIHLLASNYEEYTGMLDMINELLLEFGIKTDEIFSSILFTLLTFLLSFYSTIAVIYLCITLTATLLQNSRFKVIVSIVFFLLASEGRSKLEELIGNHYVIRYGERFLDLLFQAWPYTLLNLGVLLLSVTATTWLLKKKLSL
ncbi:MAG: hypothetical protein IJ468_10980 [Lachnospiraceae bacterium]|nr:hypothetical protein [Lachnospiraceae bacterium]